MAYTYSDFFNDFTAHPDTHDLAMKTDARSTQQGLRNLILTNTYERPYQSKLGGDVRRLLYEEVSPQIANALETRLKELIKNHAKHVVLKAISVQPHPAGRSYEVNIVYYELNNPDASTFYLQLNRIR